MTCADFRIAIARGTPMAERSTTEHATLQKHALSCISCRTWLNWVTREASGAEKQRAEAEADQLYPKMKRALLTDPELQ